METISVKRGDTWTALLDAAVRWHGHVASQGGLQAHSGASQAYQAVHIWAQKIESALKAD